MWETFKHMNIYAMEILWGEEKEAEITEGIMVEKFPIDKKLYISMKINKFQLG